MKYETIPYVNKPVSRLLFGCASPTFLKGEENNAILDAALEAGITTFDTARNYALSEKSIGMWLRERNCRDRVVLLSKCAHPDDDGTKRVSEEAIRSDFARSTELLGTDYIDIYLLHRDDPDVDVAIPVETLNALHAEGKIGAFGGSNWTHERIQEANEYACRHNLIPFTVSSPHFSLARQQQDPWGGGCVSITGEENADARAWYRQTQMPVVAYSSLGRGLFSGRFLSADQPERFLDPVALRGYGCADNVKRLARCEELAKAKNCTVSQIALAWLFRQGINAFAICAMSSPKRIAENIASLSLELSDEECRYLNLE
jgi:aryl-alcohol dehydrogenase-like predicted oxidoreductase